MTNHLKYYKEHPVFDEYTCFDYKTGMLRPVKKQEFDNVLLKPKQKNRDTVKGIERYDGKNFTLFNSPSNQYRTQFPRRIYFQITRNCNLSCSYCFLKSRQGLPHVPTNDILRMLSFLGKNGLIEIRLTGGEPTTHPDFFKIIDACQENGIYVSIATNGLLNKKILDGIIERKHLWLICSIDGNRETHNQYRPGTFDRIIWNLHYLKSNNPELRLRLTTVLTKKNQNQIRNIAKLVRDLDAESATFIPLRPQVRSSSILEDILTHDEFKKSISEIVKCIEDFNVQLTTTLAINNESKIFKDPIARKKSACAAGREATNLDYDAENNNFLVYGCSYSPASDHEALSVIRQPFIAGKFNAKNVEDFYTIWQADKAWQIYRDNSFKSDECKTCSYYEDNLCVGSCPIQNINYTDINVGTDVLSQLKAQLTQTAEWYCYKHLI